MALSVSLTGTHHHLGQDEALQELLELVPGSLVTQLVKQLPQVLTFDGGGTASKVYIESSPDQSLNSLERQHEVVAGLAELLDRAVWRAVDEAGPVEVEDSSEGRG